MKKKIEIIIKSVLNLEKLPPFPSTKNIAEWDSLAYLTIVSKIEKEFNLKLNQKNINKFDSIRNIMIQIDKCKKK